MHDSRYDHDPIARQQEELRTRRQGTHRRQVHAVPGLVVEHTDSEWCGAITEVRGGYVGLEDFRGRVRQFLLTDRFMIDGEAVQLIPAPAAPAARKRTASGSFAVAGERAKVAMPSRIFVEGAHDAELVQQVWGADLAHEGVVVEMLAGADNLLQVLREFSPTPHRRAGVLLDHLITGSKESRLAAEIAREPWAANVLIQGHPFIDIWAAVKPARLGLKAWPEIPRSIEWKKGICQHLGWAADEQADIAEAWGRIRAQVRDYRDLEPALVGRVEELIDFVTVPPQG